MADSTALKNFANDNEISSGGYDEMKDDNGKGRWIRFDPAARANPYQHFQTPFRPTPSPRPQTPPNNSSSLVLYTARKLDYLHEEARQIEHIKNAYEPRCWSPARYKPRYRRPPPSKSFKFGPYSPIEGNLKGKEREMDAMDRGDGSRTNPRQERKPGYDAFDSLEWDPDLPTSSAPDDSPQPIAIKPQPVTYTTVGSLVDPNAVPQFSAPNRIQREGANRRPLISIIRNQQFESVFQTRGPPPPLNMSNSMHYAQNLTRSPPPVETTVTPVSDLSSRSTASQVQLSEQEKEILMQQFGNSGPRSLSGNMFVPSRQAPLMSKDQIFEVKELDLETRGRFATTQGPIHGLEKMQTLQRLSKFANPVQHLARNRLSEFAVANAQAMHRNTTNPNGLEAYEMRQQVSSSQSEDSGELNLSFQFPPPGFGQSSATQTNPLLRASSNNPTQSNFIPQRPPGYPQPLTAGPPGQRQYNSSLGQHVSIHSAYDNQNRAKVVNQQLETKNTNLQLLLQQFDTNPIPSSQNPPRSQIEYPFDEFIQSHLQGSTTPPIMSHSQDTNFYKSFVPVHSGYSTTPLLDTLSPHDAEKFYPGGFPANFTGAWNEMPLETKLKMTGTTYTKKARSAEKTAELEKWFYDGQGRFWDMAEDDHLREHNERSNKKHDFGPIGPPKKVHGAIDRKPVTVEEVQRMSTAECAKPMIAALYGTLLEYSDRATPNSRANLSLFIDSNPNHIDPTPEGNKSLFGEDWGAPVKPKLSMPRY